MASRAALHRMLQQLRHCCIFRHSAYCRTQGQVPTVPSALTVSVTAGAVQAVGGSVPVVPPCINKANRRSAVVEGAKVREKRWEPGWLNSQPCTAYTEQQASTLCVPSDFAGLSSQKQISNDISPQHGRKARTASPR